MPLLLTRLKIWRDRNKWTDVVMQSHDSNSVLFLFFLELVLTKIWLLILSRTSHQSPTMTSLLRTGRRHSWSTILLLLGLCSVNAQLDETPPKYDYHNLPETKFTCEGKLTGRYYADPETDCQLFHVCAKMSRREVNDFKFLCPNGTVFDQVTNIRMRSIY